VEVQEFYLDATTVTNEQIRLFRKVRAWRRQGPGACRAG
jgi:hypothetical protein